MMLTLVMLVKNDKWLLHYFLRSVLPGVAIFRQDGYFGTLVVGKNLNAIFGIFEVYWFTYYLRSKMIVPFKMAILECLWGAKTFCNFWPQNQAIGGYFWT